MNPIVTNYEKAAKLPNEIAARLLAQLDILSFSPKVILDLGGKTGFSTKYLQDKFPDAFVMHLEVDPNFLSHATLLSHPHFLPFSPKSIDLVYSNLLLYDFDFEKVFSEIYKVLNDDGIFLFSTLGPNTFIEFSNAFQTLTDMPDLGDALLRQQFVMPVMEIENLTISYGSSILLIEQLKNLGFQKILLPEVENFILENKLSDTTMEIIYGRGIKKEINEICIPIETIKRGHHS